MSLTDRALALAASGVPVFPCLASKAPATEHGHLDATTDPAVIREHFARPGAALIGIPTGERSGVDVLDLDPRHGSDAWPDVARLPATRVRCTGGGGKHYLFRAAPGLRSSVSRIAPGVDVRATGGYVVAWPAVDETAAIADWPQWLLDAARPPARDPDADISHIEPPPSAAAVVDLLDRLPNLASNSRDVWTAVMLAAAGCAQALDDAEGIAEAACRWADRWPGSPGYHAEMSKWESDWSIRDKPLAGWRNLEARGNREIPGYAVERAVAEFQGRALPLQESPPVVRGSTMRERFLFPADCATGPRRGYVIKHLIAPGDVAAIIGPPGCGKSMLAPYLAYAVAQGRAVFGLRTKPGRTLYVAAEDATGMRQRIHALKLTHGDAPDFAMVDVGSLRDAATVTELRAAVADWRPALVVIDTLGAAFAGMDENAAADMGAVVELARALAATGCAVVLIHHVAKHGDGSPRGHSVLNGTLDMSLSLTPRDESGVIRCTMLKNRNGTTDRTMAFRFIAVPLGSDEDGDPITAPMAVELDRADARADAWPRLPPMEARALGILKTLVEAQGGQPVGVRGEMWRAACDDQRLSASDDAANRHKTITRAMNRITAAGLVLVEGGNYRLVPYQNQTEPAGTSAEPGRTKRNQPTGQAAEPRTNGTTTLRVVPGSGSGGATQDLTLAEIMEIEP